MYVFRIRVYKWICDRWLGSEREESKQEMIEVKWLVFWRCFFSWEEKKNVMGWGKLEEVGKFVSF